MKELSLFIIHTFFIWGLFVVVFLFEFLDSFTELNEIVQLIMAVLVILGFGYLQGKAQKVTF